MAPFYFNAFNRDLDKFLTSLRGRREKEKGKGKGGFGRAREKG